MIYFIRSDDGHMKFGWSMNPKHRLRLLQAANHRPLRLYAVLPGTKEDEKKVHEIWRCHWSGGGCEWYVESQELLEWIDEQVREWVVPAIYRAWKNGDHWSVEAMLTWLDLQVGIEAEVGRLSGPQLPLWDEVLPAYAEYMRAWQRDAHG